MSVNECLEAFMVGQRLRPGLMGLGGNEQWETIREETVDVTTEVDRDGTTIYGNLMLSIFGAGTITMKQGNNPENTILRLSVNGKAISEKTYYTYFTNYVGAVRDSYGVGNLWMISIDGYSDDGIDFCFYMYEEEGENGLNADIFFPQLYARNPGTYTYKVERKVK